MKYIILGFEGFIFPVAEHLQNEGCEVLVGQVIDGFYNEDRIDKKRRLMRYDNILVKMSIQLLLKKLESVSDPQNYFVICESNALYPYVDQLRELGFEGIFPTKQDRIFETDREMAKAFVKKNYPDIKVAQYKKFRQIADAQRFLENTQKVWVLKSQTDEIATFVPQTNLPLLGAKQINENLVAHKNDYEMSGFLLEEKISSIVEVTPEKIYYDGKPLGMSIMFENKHIGAANLSFQVTCAGDIVFPVSFESKIHDICFPPIVDAIAKQHKGLFIWDASLLIDQRTGEIYFGEFCPNRFGFNSFLTVLSQMPSVDSFFCDVVKQKNPYSLGSIGSSLMLFNLLQEEESYNTRANLLIEYPDRIKKNFWPYDVYKDLVTGSEYTAGYDMHLAPITSSQKTLRKSVETMYEMIDEIQINNIYYRPKFDFLSKEYPTSLLNRLEYCMMHQLFDISFKI